MMNLAFTIFYYFPFGGLQLDFRRILEETLRRGHTVTVVYDRWDGDFIPGAQYHKLPVHARTNWGKVQQFENLAEKYFSEHKFDLIVGFNRMKGLDLYFAADNCFACNSRNKNGLIRIIAPRYRVMERMEQAIFEPESRTEIMYIAEPQKQDFQKMYHTEDKRFHLLPPGIDQSFCLRPTEEAKALRQKIRAEFRIRQNALVLIQVCSAFGTKGLDRTILAMGSLPETIREQCVLLVIGRDIPGKYQRLAAGQGVQVIFTGGRNDVAELLYGADLMVHPARKEAAGSVLAESLCCGIPVITSGCCGFAPYVKESGGIVLQEPFSQNELNEKLNQILADSVLYAEMKKQTMQYAAAAHFHDRQKTAVDLMEEMGRHA